MNIPSGPHMVVIFFTLVCVSSRCFAAKCVFCERNQRNQQTEGVRDTGRSTGRDTDRLTAAAAAKTSIISIIINTLVTILLQETDLKGIRHGFCH